MTSTSSAIFENNVRSTLLLGVTAALVLVAAWALGYTLGNIPMGIGIGVLACVVIIPIQMATTKAAILTITKGRPANASDPRERQLLDRIAQLSRNAGLTRVPPLYVTSAQSPNAFASGLGESSAFVCVTQGLLDTMSLDEISGVIGHELGHVKHGDIRLNTIVNGMTTTLTLLCLAIEILGRTGAGGSRNRRDNQGAGLGAIILLAAVLMRPFISIISALLQMAISRKREFAADAFAVQVNGSSRGIGDALEDLGRMEKRMTRQDAAELGGSQLASMYFSFPKIGELFATHPPLEERVRRIRQMRVDG